MVVVIVACVIGKVVGSVLFVCTLWFVVMAITAVRAAAVAGMLVADLVAVVAAMFCIILVVMITALRAGAVAGMVVMFVVTTAVRAGAAANIMVRDLVAVRAAMIA